MSNYWSQGSIKTYASKFSAIARFERTFGITVFAAPSLTKPPTGQSIVLMWAQEFHSLQRRPSNKDPHSDTHVSFATIRQIRSAAAQHLTWQHIITNPDTAFLDQRRKMIMAPVRPTDSVSNTIFATGLAARLGTESKPSVALLARHVHALDQSLLKLYQSASTWR
jgi:hypothetical protein